MASAQTVSKGIVFAVLSAYILFSPAARQVFEWRQEWFRPWVMFSGSGLEATEVRFVTRQADGTETPLDRFEMLAPDDAAVRAKMKRVKDPATAKSLARSMCRKLRSKSDVRVYLREATREGWNVSMSGEINMCEND